MWQINKAMCFVDNENYDDDSDYDCRNLKKSLLKNK